MMKKRRNAAQDGSGGVEVRIDIVVVVVPWNRTGMGFGWSGPSPQAPSRCGGGNPPPTPDASRFLQPKISRSRNNLAVETIEDFIDEQINRWICGRHIQSYLEVRVQRFRFSRRKIGRAVESVMNVAVEGIDEGRIVGRV